MLLAPLLHAVLVPGLVPLALDPQERVLGEFPVVSAATAALEPSGVEPQGGARAQGAGGQGSRPQGPRAQGQGAQGPRVQGAGTALDDPQARQRAQEDFERLGRNHGARAWVDDDLGVSVDVWSSLPGLRFDLLETTFINSSPAGPQDESGWGVHNRVPRLIHIQPPASGYLLTEFVLDSEVGDEYASVYQRMVADGKVAWSEFGGGAVREPDAERRARGLVGRELFMGAMPLGLDAQKYRAAFLREDESGALVYMIRMPRVIQIFEMETAREFALYLDPETYAPLQLQFITLESRGFGDGFTLTLDFDDWRQVELSPEIREHIHGRLLEAWRQAKVRAWKQAQPDPATAEPPADLLASSPTTALIEIPTAIKLPYRRYIGGELGRQLTELWMEDPVVEALPPGALERPWLSGRLFGHSIRADFWDPPAAAEQPSDPGAQDGGN